MATTPTFAELMTQLTNLVEVFERTREFGEVNTENFLALQEQLILSPLESDFGQAVLDGVTAMRSSLASALSTNAAAAMGAHMLDWAKFLNLVSSDPQVILDELYQYFIDNSKTVNSRDITFGAPAAITGSSTGVIHRLAEDENGLALENVRPEAVDFEVIQDANSGTEKGKELWEITGERFIDAVETKGSGLFAQQANQHPDEGLLLNPSFDSVAGDDATPDDVTNWTSDVAVVGDGSDYEVDRTDFFLPATRPARSIGSLKIKLARTLTQKFSARGTRLNPLLPNFCSVAYNASAGSATGSLTLKRGSKTVSVADLTAVAAGWNVLFFSLDKDLWFPNWNLVDPGVELTYAPSAAGVLRVDDVQCQNMINLGGTWYMFAPGATPALRGDTSSLADTELGAIIQLWLFRLLGRFLPHATGGLETEPDPT